MLAMTSFANAASLDDAEAYLNNITTLRADFAQIAPDGSYARGELFVKRPGKMRWNYARPNAIEMVANDDSLIYYDPEMDEVSYLSLDETLASIITKPHISFDNDEIKLLHVEDEAGLLRVSIAQRQNLENGRLSFVFRTQPMQLYQLLVENEVGDVTIITLDTLRMGEPLNDKLFRFKRPQKGQK